MSAEDIKNLSYEVFLGKSKRLDVTENEKSVRAGLILHFPSPRQIKYKVYFDRSWVQTVKLDEIPLDILCSLVTIPPAHRYNNIIQNIFVLPVVYIFYDYTSKQAATSLFSQLKIIEQKVKRLHDTLSYGVFSGPILTYFH